jgi:serine/threonine-protein kinase RsbW
MSAERTVIGFTIPSDLAEMQRIQERIGEALTASAYSERETISIGLALEEALSNAIKHGNRMDPDKRVSIVCELTPERFDVCISDEGEGFHHEGVPDPSEDTSWSPGGRGLLLIHMFMTAVQYHGKGNVVTMSKVRGSASGTSRKS